MTMTVVCGQLLDGNGGPSIADAVIEVDTSGVIRFVGLAAHGGVPSTTRRLDLSAYWVLPGLIDCHEHLGIDPGDEVAQAREPIEYIAARAAARAGQVLRAGITTIRDLGEKGRLGQELRRAISEGVLPGPRILAAGRPIVRSGGHAHEMGVEADGPDMLRRAVRNEVQAGADVIKAMVSGGISTPDSDVLAPEFTDEEIEAIVEEAHRRGRRVAAHGHGGDGVRAAIRAGVDSIEHGLLLTEGDIEMMVEQGTYLVVTMGVMRRIMEDSSGDPAFEFQRKKLEGIVGGFRQILVAARRFGLRVALGTDENHGRLYEEMQVLVDAGYSPMEAILAGTRSGAELCGIEQTLGTLEPGKYADLIAVGADPRTDLGALGDVKLVLKGGVVEFDDRAS